MPRRGAPRSVEVDGERAEPILEPLDQGRPLRPRAGAGVDADHRIAGGRVVDRGGRAHRSRNLARCGGPRHRALLSRWPRRAASASRASAVPKPKPPESRTSGAVGRKAILRASCRARHAPLDFLVLGDASSRCTPSDEPASPRGSPPWSSPGEPACLHAALARGLPCGLAGRRPAATRACRAAPGGPQGGLAAGPGGDTDRRVFAAGTSLAGVRAGSEPCLIRPSESMSARRRSRRGSSPRKAPCCPPRRRAAPRAAPPPPSSPWWSGCWRRRRRATCRCAASGSASPASSTWRRARCARPTATGCPSWPGCPSRA